MATRSRLGHDGHKYKVEARLGQNGYKEEAGPGQDKQEEGDGHGHNEHQEETS